MDQKQIWQGRKRQRSERDDSRKAMVEREEKQHYLEKLEAQLGVCYIPDIKKTALFVLIYVSIPRKHFEICKKCCDMQETLLLYTCVSSPSACFFLSLIFCVDNESQHVSEKPPGQKLNGNASLFFQGQQPPTFQ